ncbi:MAG: carboxypeptidase regulatory-like domain-containing protein, partial [Gemmatimonadales bacterium]
MKVGTLLGWALLCTAPPVEMAAQTVVGRVVDARTAAPVIEARVNLLHGELVVATASTDNTGRFRFIDLMRGSSYALKVTRIGYRELLTPRFELRGTGEFNLELEPVAVEIDPIVITASRLRQRAREAAASVSVISRAEIEHRPTTTTADHVRNLQGVDLISAGLIQHNIVARGFNNVASGAMLLMTDNRYSGVPSLRLNTYYLLP